MSLYVLRYGTERGKGDYLTPLGRSIYQHNAARIARRALVTLIRADGHDVRLVRLRPKRTLIGYVVRLDGPATGGPLWVGSKSTDTTTIPAYRLVLRTRHGGYGAVPLAEDWCVRGFVYARVVPVYLRVRP